MSTEWLVWLGQLAGLPIAFLIAVFLGGKWPGRLSEHLYEEIEKAVEPEPGDIPLKRVPKLPRLMGYVERALVFIVVVWAQQSAGTAIAGLLAVKMVGGWGSIKTGTTRARASYSISLICGLISIMTALVLGLLARQISPWTSGFD
jgi:hypothetical protein